MNINREYFYKKELTFKVSCSYGPGRYDPSYEKYGTDYPIGFVRWTEKRNFEAVLNILKNKKVDFKSLITNRFKILEAKKAYEFLYKDSNYIGILFDYDSQDLPKNKTIQINKNSIAESNEVSVSVIGAGNYSKRIIIPHLSKTKASLQTITSRNGFDSTFLANKFNFKESSTDTDKIWSDSNTNTVFILTRHNSHAEFIIKAFESGKNVFVEKPICTTEKELELILAAFKETRNSDGTGPILMVGFNRRFSKFSKLLKKELFNIKTPKSYIYTCNAGFLDKDHWTNNHKLGGGRLIGEACHLLI